MQIVWVLNVQLKRLSQALWLYGVLGVSSGFAAGGSEELYHSVAFQRTFYDVRQSPLNYLPTDLLARDETESRLAIQLAVQQQLQGLRKAPALLSSAEKQWVLAWQQLPKEQNDFDIPTLAGLLLKEMARARDDHLARWLSLSRAQLTLLNTRSVNVGKVCLQLRQTSWEPADFQRATQLHLIDELPRIALACQHATLMGQLLKRADAQYLLPMLAFIPQTFDDAQSLSLLTQAAIRPDLSVVAMPILAELFADQASVQQLLIDGLSKDILAATSAASLARFGNLKTMQHLRDLLARKSFNASASQFAEIAIQGSIYAQELK